MLDVALLGTGGMMPLPNRFLTSMLCRLNGRLLMIDCGECTQVSLKMLGWGYKNIDTICFTHFHADHIAGLPGLLLTIGNSGRTEPINIIGPKGLQYIVKHLCVIAPELPFELIINEFDTSTGINDMRKQIGSFNIGMFPADHRVQCFAYSIEISRRGRFDVTRAEKLNLPVKLWSRLQNDEEVEYEGKLYSSDMVLGSPRKGIKLCYCTDSRPLPGLSSFVKNADLFICEGIYGEDEKLDKAIDHRHMIFSEAATIAKDGNVHELWLTHYSPSLTDPAAHLKYALDIFPNSVAAYDRINKTIYFEE